MRRKDKLAMLLVMLGALCAICGCSTTPIAPPISEHTVQVKIPVPVACVDASKVPAEPKRVAGDLTGNAVHDLDVISASAIDLRTWGEKLAALVQPCTKP